MNVRASWTFLAVALLALVALSSVSAEPRSASKFGGTLVVGVTRGEPGSLDPVRSTTFGAVIAYRTFCQKLYDTGPKAEIVPQLAAALPTISKDKLTYTIPLRRGVLFNDGTQMDADAVVKSIEQLKSDRSNRASDLDPIAGATAVAPSTVVLRLKQPFAPLLEILATPAGVVMSPTQMAKLGENFSREPICVGPFMFDFRIPGDSLTVIKSPYYFDRGRVYLDKVVFKYLPDPAAAAALKAGDVQVVDSISPTEIPGVEAARNVSLVRRRALGYQSVEFNIGNQNGFGTPPYTNLGTAWSSNAKLRQAFEEAIDRKTLARVVFGGFFEPGCTPVSPSSVWFEPKLTCTSYDPAHAHKLVVGSGIANPTLHLLMSDDVDTQRLEQFIQAEEAAVGIKVLFEPNYGQTGTGDFEAHLSDWAGGADPDRNLYAFFATYGTRNRAGYSSPRFDFVVENARKATTEQARRTLYRVAQEILLADRPAIVLGYPVRVAAVRVDAVSGVDFFPDTQLRVAFAQLR